MKTIIAIFEDDPVNRFIYDRLLKHRKDEIEVYIFDNPAEGISKAKETRFDVVYIEMHFWENFGGVKILKQLREAGQQQMIAVAMTSLLQKGDLEYAMASGFNICLEKPIVFAMKDFSNIP